MLNDNFLNDAHMIDLDMNKINEAQHLYLNHHRDNKKTPFSL